jgi:hypothetical protein
MNPTFPFPEKLLHFVWQFQRFEKNHLISDDGQAIQIIQIGQLNTNAGPDFLESKIQIGEIVWVGNIEIHINSSDWYTHKHDQNADFDSVVLHVVWENDRSIIRKNGQNIPILSLKNRVNQKLLHDYKALMSSSSIIPCYSQFSNIGYIHKTLMLEKVMVARLERKAEIIIGLLNKNNGNWEETTYQLLAKTMGFGLNSIPFERLARLLPLKILQKHQDSLFSIEALLFGVAGFLADAADEYSQKLSREYQFLKAKYGLDNEIPKHEWKFMRTRPANFPTLRIAQFAKLMHQTKSLFSYFILSESPDSLKNIFQIVPSDYWQVRYNFGDSNLLSNNKTGDNTIENLLINAIAPLLVAYSMDKNETAYIEKAMNLLEGLKPEDNKIIRFWKQLEFIPKSAFESQASIELFNEYCLKNRCLSCNIGVNLMK